MHANGEQSGQSSTSADTRLGYARDHAGHNACAVPGCPTFHLFCFDCGGRRHASGAPRPSRSTTDGSAIDGRVLTAYAFDDGWTPGPDEYGLAGTEG
jgi:hypothetical protein